MHGSTNWSGEQSPCLRSDAIELLQADDIPRRDLEPTRTHSWLGSVGGNTKTNYLMTVVRQFPYLGNLSE